MGEEKPKALSAKQALARTLGTYCSDFQIVHNNGKKMLIVLKKQQACLKPAQMALELAQREREGSKK